MAPERLVNNTLGNTYRLVCVLFTILMILIHFSSYYSVEKPTGEHKRRKIMIKELKHGI